MATSFVARFALMIYVAATNLLAPPIGLFLLPVLLFSRKRRKTLLPRLGFQRYPRAVDHPPTAHPRMVGPVWIHALSVGELLSCVPLLRELRSVLPSRPLYLSVSTLAAHDLALEKLATAVDGLFYFPYDLLLPVQRCLRALQPALFLLIETDIWPGFLGAMRRRKLPCFLLNARLSPSSYRFSRLFSVLFRPAFATFARIYPQSLEDGQRFFELGVDAQSIHPPGNMKFDLTSPLPSSESLGQLRQHLGIGVHHQVMLAGSTHPGEEAILRSAFLLLRRTYPDLKLIIAPRHPHRATEVMNLFADDRLGVGLFSQSTGAPVDVVVVDRLGVLAGLYALADVTFVGGSLVNKGGQNPIEPAAAGKPVLFGPDMSDFPEISRWLLEKGGAFRVNDTEALAAHSHRLLADSALALQVGGKARAVVDEHRGTTRRIAAEISAFLQTAAERG